MNRVKTEGRDVEKILQWLGWADEDYLAARALLIGGYLVQGTVLANTAIEKYLKTGLIARGAQVPRSHNVSALYAELTKTGKVLALNSEFLDVLGRAYQLRYPDQLAVGFNVALIAVKVLVELDCCVHEIRSGFEFKRTSGRPVITKLEKYKEIEHPGLLLDNCAFGTASRTEIFARLTRCYEIRVIESHGIMEAHYQAGAVPDDSKFNCEAMKPTRSADTGQLKCDLQYAPVGQ